jgi:hypothetical protein
MDETARALFTPVERDAAPLTLTLSPQFWGEREEGAPAQPLWKPL